MRRSADHDDVTAPLTARRAFRALILVLALALAVLVAPPSSRSIAAPRDAVPAAYDQDYRPQFHYSAKKNWLNDPNGLVYYKRRLPPLLPVQPAGQPVGQHVLGPRTSRGLGALGEQPVAIPQTFNSEGQSIEDIFSGSAVVDTNNTSGFGTKANPPMVAIYTSAYTSLTRPWPGVRRSRSLTA